jgi:hypothetical protein
MSRRKRTETCKQFNAVTCYTRASRQELHSNVVVYWKKSDVSKVFFFSKLPYKGLCGIMNDLALEISVSYNWETS